ncbi:Coenzyme F420 hydrogenase/dehydrogenase, beta subunit C-terminal domain [Alkalibacter saccharofermentans]|uniref:Coenzyme F420-reducing hydrogenase, beta subunit n=1 Tax=Alkalibacter saccharofermentans DSM 14828 TaxID=1120975 RepID=A0A1M4WQ99_9FIRM|nr:Coenzyme F420 hydrogenase/dehydrogenase, beta subunit C-terminal domain [Alkalibacter saccharofermentans]SHE83384.1 Coenzyme F420-reducing hydrogenase, beta subunit [Alkalibacter saccharofermentans DSM 14828]
MIDKMIKANKDCMGCHACKNVCPTQCIIMTPDEEGFLYPKVEYSLCVKCKKCISVCPIINKARIVNNPQAYAAINKDEQIRLSSSSGGIFTLLAENAIKDDGVVFGAGYSEKFEVAHKSVEKIEELCELRGSKYVQSKIGNSYKLAKDFLDSGRKVLFSGTPCQIAGLNSYLNRSYENLITQDFICHGVPSPIAWRKYIEYRETKAESKVSQVEFRNKDKGWKQFSVSFIFENDIGYSKNLNEDLYMRAFLKDLCLRPSCYDCEFKTLNRQSDLTLADFWGIEKVLPEMDDDKGTSLIIVNNKKGQEVFNSISGNMKFKEVDINEAVKYNSAAIKSVNYNPKRKEFLSALNTMPFNKLVDKYCDESFVVKFKRRARRVIKNALK